MLTSYEFVANDEITNKEHYITTMTDIVSENCIKNQLTVTEINLKSPILIDKIKPQMMNYNLWLTKIDYHLVVKDQLEDISCENKIIWNKANLDKIPKSDLIIINYTDELREMDSEILINDLYKSIRDKGFLLIVFRYNNIELEEVTPDLNPEQNTISESQIEAMLRFGQVLGLTPICRKYDSMATMAVLLRNNVKSMGYSNDNQIIEITTETNIWFEKLKYKLSCSFEKKNKLWLIARDTNINGVLGLINCLRVEPGGENLRSIFYFNNSIELPFDWNSKPFSDILNKDLVINVIKDGKLGTYRHLKLDDNYDKTESNEYFLNLGRRKDLSSIGWFDCRSIVANEEFLDINGVRANLVPIKIYCSGLISHDVMLALGKFFNSQFSSINQCNFIF